MLFIILHPHIDVLILLRSINVARFIAFLGLVNRYPLRNVVSFLGPFSKVDLNCRFESGVNAKWLGASDALRDSRYESGGGELIAGRVTMRDEIRCVSGSNRGL